MNRWDQHSFAKRIAEQMSSQRSTTSYELVGDHQIVIKIDESVILTLTIGDTALDAEYRPSRPFEGSADLAISDARDFYKNASFVVAEELGLTEKTPARI